MLPAAISIKFTAAEGKTLFHRTGTTGIYSQGVMVGINLDGLEKRIR